MKLRLAISAVLALTVAVCAGNEWRMPQAQFERFKNIEDPRDGSGSCVQASLSMVGAHHGIAAFEFLLVNSPYGPAETGGSTPSRVVRYARQRGVAIYSVEGSETIQWIEWALLRGCYVGITYGQAHMITAIACGEQGEWFEVVDNNFPSEVRRVDRDIFIREHRIHGGGWCVIPQTPGPAPWAKAGQMLSQCALPRGPSGTRPGG